MNSSALTSSNNNADTVVMWFVEPVALRQRRHNEEFVLAPCGAAVSIQRADMVEGLLANGALMYAAAWTCATCFEVVDAGDVHVLPQQRRSQDASACEGVNTPW